MATGKATFNSIYAELATEYSQPIEALSPGLSEKATYYAYEQFYSKHDLLDLRTRFLASIASLVSQGQLDDLELHIIGALNSDATLVEISETILQMSIYAGEPKAKSAMRLFIDLSKKHKLKFEKAYSSLDTSRKLPSSDDIFKRLFGEQKAKDTYAFLKTLSPGLEIHAIEHPFGQFYAKENLLDLKTRELITIASLVTLGMLPQLQLHIGAALHIGCTYTQIEQVILQMGAYAGNPAMLNAMKELKSFQDTTA